MALKTKTWQEILDEEKLQRSKGIANDQVAELVKHLQELDIPTVWDVQPAYDADFLGLKDRCHFGLRGLCCRNCAMGPCRLASEDMPAHMKAVSPRLNRSTCGKTHDSMVASMLLSEEIRGTASHLDHALHVVETFLKVCENKTGGNYTIKDENKLISLAHRLGIETNHGKSVMDVAKEVGQIAYDDLVGGKGFHEPMKFFLALAPQKNDRIKKAGLIPSQGACVKILKAEHSTAQGMMSNTFELLKNCLQLGAYDAAGLFIATELQDILLGSPKPAQSYIGVDALKVDYVNIVVHGHVPTLSSKVVELARELESEAKKAGAAGIQVLGICCTGNELLERWGIRMLGNNLHQEIIIGTGLVDAMVVDVQCVYPGLSTITQSYQTKLITTCPELRMENETYIPFREEYAGEDSARIVREAINAYKERKKEKIFMPAGKGCDIMAGFSPEACLSVLSKINPNDPLKPLVDLIKDGSIQGVAVLAGCTSPKIQADMSFVTIAKKLLANNVLIIATGCAAGACGRNNLLTVEAVQYAGDKLKGVLEILGKAAGFNTPLPPVWHMGSCVDNSRPLILAKALSDYLGVSNDMLPVVASAAENVAEKATAIGTGVVVLGITTHVGVPLKVGGSPFVMKVLSKEIENITGSRFIINPNPEEAADELLEEIRKKRKALGI